MTSAIATYVAEARVVDTHEHLAKERDFLAADWDVLTALFDNYVRADLVVAGSSSREVERFLDPNAGGVAERFAAMRPHWEACKHTGYGEAVRLTARALFDLDELTPETLEAADVSARVLRQPGERLRLLRDVAKLDHVQIDDFDVRCLPDDSGPDFFLYDIGLAQPISGRIDVEDLLDATGVQIRDLDSLEEALTEVFARFGPVAVAVKSQHAYQRTLAWEPRGRGDAAHALAAVLAGSAELPERLCIGDWIWARAVELAIEHHLPFKLHTGYYAGAGTEMSVEWIRPGQLSPLLARYPEARFVLMHGAYPFGGELVAVAKHFPNVWVDLCWAWAIDPHTTCELFRTCLHAVPSDKLFAFGGDNRWPTGSVGYALQARRWLVRALEAEVAEGDLTEHEALVVARRVLQENQLACFDVAGTRTAIAERR